MEDRKPIVKSADMSEDMQRDAFECAATVRGACGGGGGRHCVLFSREPLCVARPRGACARAKRLNTTSVLTAQGKGGNHGRPAAGRAEQSPARASRFRFWARRALTGLLRLPHNNRPSTSTPSKRTSRPTSSASSTSGTRPRGTAWWAKTLVRGRGGGDGRVRAASKHALTPTPPHIPGSFVTHETKCFVYFYLGHLAVLLFKSG
jgi:Dynein light chain type 1